MQNRIIEVLMQIAEHLHNHPQDKSDVQEMTKTLTDQGYTPEEINAALVWLFQMMRPALADIRSEEKEYSQPLIKTIRILNDFENLILSTEAYGYLIQLRELGLIGNEQTESVMERALMSGSTEIGLEDMRMISASVLFDPFNLGRTGSRLTFESFIEGSEKIH